jgi:hypothetical protein
MYTLKEMKDACKQAGIKGISKLSKQELINFINGSDMYREIYSYFPKLTDDDDSDPDEPTEGRYYRQIDYGDFVDGSYIIHPITEVLDELPEDASDRGYAPAEKLRTGLSSLIRTEQENPEKLSVSGLEQFIKTDKDPTTESTDNPFASRFTSGDVVPLKPTTPTPPATPNIKPLPKPQSANVPAAAELEVEEFITVLATDLKHNPLLCSFLPPDVFLIENPLDGSLTDAHWESFGQSYFKQFGQIVYRWYHGTSEWKLQRAVVSADGRCNCKNGANDCIHKNAIKYIEAIAWRTKRQQEELERSHIRQEQEKQNRDRRDEILDWLRQGSRFSLASQLANKRYGYTKPFFDLSLGQLEEIKSEIEKAIV